MNGNENKVDSLEMIDLKIKNVEPNQKELSAMTNANLTGVDNLLVGLGFLVKTGNVVHDVTAPESANGAGIALTEYPQFIPLAMDLPGLIKSIPKIPFELVDQITDEERNQVEAKIMESDYVKDLIAKGADQKELIDDHLKEIINLKNFLFKYYIHVDNKPPMNVQ